VPTAPESPRPDEVLPWTEPYPYEIHQLASGADWQRLLAKYSRQPQSEAGEPPQPTDTDRPLRRCLEVARENAARTAVVETRYIDLDYRSEYSSFYSRAFLAHEDSTHRIHFFKAELAADQLFQLPGEPGYLGYMIIRPQVRGVVGRTMLAPPDSLRGAVRTGVVEKVNFFGQKLEVRAVPFMQQDARLGSCAHAAAWVCHYSAWLAGRGVARRTIAEFSEAADPGLLPGRIVPSTGLSVQQLSKLMSSFGLPPLYYEVKSLRASDRPESWPARTSKGKANRVAADAATKRVCCRYLNSALPVLAIVVQWRDGSGADGHAMVACGYVRLGNDEPDVHLIVNDDRRGPYLLVRNVISDEDPVSLERFSWAQVLIPLPEKLWLSGEAAERNGCIRLLAAARKAKAAGVPGAEWMLQLHADERLTVRTYATTSNRYKERLRLRTRDPILLQELSEARFPRYIWVVEAIHRSERESGRLAGLPPHEVRCVAAEILFDATSDDMDPVVLATRLPGFLALPKPYNPYWDTDCAESLLGTGGQYGP